MFLLILQKKFTTFLLLKCEVFNFFKDKNKNKN